MSSENRGLVPEPTKREQRTGTGLVIVSLVVLIWGLIGLYTNGTTGIAIGLTALGALGLVSFLIYTIALYIKGLQKISSEQNERINELEDENATLNNEMAKESETAKRRLRNHASELLQLSFIGNPHFHPGFVTTNQWYGDGAEAAFSRLDVPDEEALMKHLRQNAEAPIRECVQLRKQRTKLLNEIVNSLRGCLHIAWVCYESKALPGNLKHESHDPELTQYIQRHNTTMKWMREMYMKRFWRLIEAYGPDLFELDPHGALGHDDELTKLLLTWGHPKILKEFWEDRSPALHDKAKSTWECYHAFRNAIKRVEAQWKDQRIPPQPPAFTKTRDEKAAS